VTGVGGESGVDGELESTAGESGVRVGVRRNGNESDESGAGLIGGELLLGFGDGGVFGVGGFVEEIGAGIAEGDAASGIVVDGKGGLARGMLGGGRRRDLGFGGGRLSWRGAGMGGVAAGENERAESEKNRDGFR